MIPKISSYGEYSTDNYGLNTLSVDLGKIQFLYSYETIVAFHYQGKRYVCENIWGTTTGKHLNWIDGGDKKNRLGYEEFQAKLQKAMTELGLT